VKNILKPIGNLVTINQHKMHIFRSGNANNPKIVFMSGSGTVAPVYDFKILYEKLVQDYRIIVIEKFGYGYSDIVDCPCDIDSLVTMQKDALNTIGETGPYILAPHSMAGIETIRWKQMYPNDVSAIIGLDIATPSVYKSWTEKELAKRINIMKVARKLMFHKFVNVCQMNKNCLSTDEIAQVKLLRKRNAFNNCYINEANEVLMNADRVAEAGNVECPTLLFSSNGKQTSNDWIIHQQSFAAIMNAELIKYDCGHYIHHFKSDEMCKEIKTFINNLPMNNLS